MMAFIMTVMAPVSFAQGLVTEDMNGTLTYNDLDNPGNEKIKEVILSKTKEFFNVYYKCVENLSLSKEISEYAIDNNKMYFFLKTLESDIYSRKASGSEIKNTYIDFIEIINSEVLEDGDVKADIYVRARYEYTAPSAKELSGTGDLYHMQFSKTGAYKISDISSDSPEYQNKLSNVSVRLQEVASNTDLIRQKIDISFDDYYARVDERMQELNQLKGIKGVETVEPDVEDKSSTGSDASDEISLLAAYVPYDAATAARYAYLKGSDYDTLIFKRISDNDGGDCTNFVSQCLWVGYDGDQDNNWYTAEGVTACRSLAYANYRQIGGSSGWWGASQGGSSTLPARSWRAVEELWPYITSSSSGPRGSKYYNSKIFDSTSNMVVMPGDILQFGAITVNGVLRYVHSVMVVTGNTALTNINNIYVGQHSNDHGYRMLSNLLADNPTYKYIRVIRPTQGSFNS